MNAENRHTSPDTAELLAALAWQFDLGIDEPIADAPIDRYALAAAPAPTPSLTPAAPKPQPKPADTASHVVEAQRLAATATDLKSLAIAMEQFDGCELKLGARNFVFADGDPGAHLMIVGEAPGRDEDRLGRPFVGRAGQLLDRMLAAIGHDRTSEPPEQGVYITNVLPWRPPQNRDPTVEEMAMMKAFLRRHIELAAPEVLLLMGNSAMKTLFEVERGITAMRGQWREVAGIPAIATFHPAALLRRGEQKRAAWQDLLDVKARLAGKEGS
ncbi:uracil-DNA glycosylase [Pontivivens ytuae]|uniref:Type-4 uracil-DNA glycosylase n=1 Tax=Pontivivens ytuae TaxID=2789856 RepID=A0A7S9LNE7_9RHOB|nr:uracil-DNA glycosylase [Pontivivens ytuae]QPH52303.1 uracil-DNA glycosylase [Pontivivens ytuae]